MPAAPFHAVGRIDRGIAFLVPLAQRAKSFVHRREHRISDGERPVSVGRSGLHRHREVRNQAVRAEAPTAAFREEARRRFDGTGNTHHGQTRGASFAHLTNHTRPFLRGKAAEKCNERCAYESLRQRSVSVPRQSTKAATRLLRATTPHPSISSHRGRSVPPTSTRKKTFLCKLRAGPAAWRLLFLANRHAQTSTMRSLSENVPLPRSRSSLRWVILHSRICTETLP